MPELRRISLNPFLGGDATRLLQAREEAARLHASGDIRAAGNQVEVHARKIFRRRLSARYRVTMEHSILEPPNIQREIIFLEPSSYQLFK